MKFSPACSFFSPALIRLLLLLLLSLALVPLHEAGAAQVGGLYQATVPVNSRTSEDERVQAFRTGLRQVIVKLSGVEQSLDNPLIARALNNAGSYVEASGYRTYEAASAGGAERIALEVSYYESEVQRLLDAASIPVWPGNRPETIVWLVVQDERGERTLLGSAGQDTPILASLRRSAAGRGLPLILPILDLQDQVAIRPDALWEFDREALLRASERYQAQSILALRVHRLIGGEMIARALYMFRGQEYELETVQNSLDDFLRQCAGIAASELAANYAILLSGIGANSSVQLVVNGVDSPADYAGVLRYLQSLAVVKGVQLRSVAGDTLQLELDTGGQLRQLLEIIALDRRMAPLGEPLRDDQQVSMAYQWQGS